MPKGDEVVIKVEKVFLDLFYLASHWKVKFKTDNSYIFSSTFHFLNLIFLHQVAICGSDIALYTWNEMAQVILRTFSQCHLNMKEKLHICE